MLTTVNYFKPEERGWRWTGLYPRATHQGKNLVTSFFRRKSASSEKG